MQRSARSCLTVSHDLQHLSRLTRSCLPSIKLLAMQCKFASDIEPRDGLDVAPGVCVMISMMMMMMILLRPGHLAYGYAPRSILHNRRLQIRPVLSMVLTVLHESIDISTISLLFILRIPAVLSQASSRSIPRVFSVLNPSTKADPAVVIRVAWEVFRCLEKVEGYIRA